MNIESPKIHPRNHLEKGIKPIYVCIDKFLNDLPSFKGFDKGKVDNIYYWGKQEHFDKNNMLTAGRPENISYIISDINSRNKFSKEYARCTGLAVVGIDNKTGKNISLMSHQDPVHFLVFNKKPFYQDLGKRLEELKNASKPGSIDAVLFGGSDREDNYNTFREAMTTVSDFCKEKLGFVPTIATGPQEKGGESNAYLDTENRRLYIFMPEQQVPEKYEDFKASEIKKQINKINNATDTSIQK